MILRGGLFSITLLFFLFCQLAKCSPQHDDPIANDVTSQRLFTSPAVQPIIRELSAVPNDAFVEISHSYFPRRSVTIKRTQGFCDDSVNSYTGYLHVGTRHLFFYFFESRSDPEKDDVLLWTNGGPGGSSAVGLFEELGPCSIKNENETTYNPHSWNSFANILFIDQPVGTGFSYADYGETVTSTEESAKDISAFLFIFFETFQSFKGRGFHLTGESYAGRFLPIYAAEIYDQNLKLAGTDITPINLKSVMIGNGATSWTSMLVSYYDVGCTNAIIPAPHSIERCVRMKKAIPRCLKRIEESCVEIWDTMNCMAAQNFCAEELAFPFFELGLNQHDMTKKCVEYPCYEMDHWLEAYLNNQTTREILGVDPSFGKFQLFTIEVQSTFWAKGDQMHQNYNYVLELLERGIRFLIYAGDYDWICNWVSNQRWTLEMPWSKREEFVAEPLREWIINGTAVGKTRSAGPLTFATVHAGGHLLPYDRPVEALEMLRKWLLEERL